MPSLITNHKKQETVTKLKQAYSVLSQALAAAEVEYGDMATWDCYFESGVSEESFNRKEFLINFAKKYVIPYLNSAKDYGYINALSSLGYKGSSWSSYYFMLPNGALIETTMSSGCKQYEDNKCIESGYYNLLMKIDINGLRGPNYLGKDIFITEVARNGKFIMFGSSSSRDSALKNCKSEGVFCGYLIQHDGWQILSDYPR